MLSFYFRESNEFKLKIDRVLLSDAGNYTCKASNDKGKIDSEMMAVKSEFINVDMYL